MENREKIRVENLTFYYTVDPAIKDISLTAETRSVLALIGPSGCGKTTLLKIIAGLLPATAGKVDVFGIQDKPGPDMMFVFQEYNRSLFPWRTVFRNVGFGLEQLKLPKMETRDRVLKYLKIVRLEDFAQRYPWELSGGMQQRVAIARALACEPQVLLMDEPFGSLDALSRSALEDDLLQLWKELDLTILFVTHDIDEAIYLADNVIVISTRPSEVTKNVMVKLPRPRQQIETKNLTAFGEYRAKIGHLLGRDNHV